MKKTVTLFLTILLILNTAACSFNKLNRYEADFLVLFDTATKVIGYAKNKEEFTLYSQFVYDTLKEYHELYDIYNDYEGINNIKTINDNAGIAPVEVDQRIIDLLVFSKEAYENTHGNINIAFGAVLKIWHDYREAGIDDPANAKLPPMDKLKSAALHTDFSNVMIDEDKHTVFLKDAQMSLDVGAVAKGYAVEQVCRLAKENGYTNGLVSVGGNVKAVGTRGEKHTPWNVGIQDPFCESEEDTVYTLKLSDMSLVTSGDYQRYYTVDGKKYHHIIHPDTLMPTEYFSAVTIVCEDSGMADALSTSVFNMPYEQGLAFIESLPDTEAIWIFKDGEKKYSSNFASYIKDS